jgi:hypothetical protein
LTTAHTIGKRDIIALANHFSTACHRAIEHNARIAV